MVTSQSVEFGVGRCLFDDVTGSNLLADRWIETDSILDDRADRVIPLWAEEQGLMSLVISRSVRAGTIFVDLGAGSGVFSIVAASLGCRVLALEVNQRAI